MFRMVFLKLFQDSAHMVWMTESKKRVNDRSEDDITVQTHMFAEYTRLGRRLLFLLTA